MKINQLRIRDSIVIIAIVICASIGYYVTSTIVKRNVIQYSTLPQEVNMKVYDELHEDSVIYRLPVISKLRIDSIPPILSEDNITSRNILYHQNPIFLVWLMLISIMMAIAAGSFPVFIVQIWQLKVRFKLSSNQVLTGFIYAIIVVLILALNSSDLIGYYKPPDIIDDFHILLKHGYIINCIVIATTILSIPTFLVIFISAISSDNISFKNSAEKNIKGEGANQIFTDDDLLKRRKMELEVIARQFEFLNQSLKGAMQILAIIVVFSVLTSSALRMSIKSVVEIKYYDIFPVEASYVYGMYFSLFLCIMYIPSYIYLKNRYAQFKEYLNIQQFEEQWSQSILGTVKFEGTALDNLKLAFTILAPLISSFLPDSLHFLK